jgi:hypothetical protein
MRVIFLNKGGRLSTLFFIFLCFILLVGFFGISSTGSSSPIEEVVQDENKASFLDLPDYFEVKKGEEFILDIDFDEEFVFSDDSDLLLIDKDTGVLSFVSEELGEFKVVIIALKDVDDFHYKLVKFRVVE